MFWVAEYMGLLGEWHIQTQQGSSTPPHPTPCTMHTPLPSGCSSVSFYKQQVNVKCFPKFHETVYQIIKAKKEVMGTPIYL